MRVTVGAFALMNIIWLELDLHYRLIMMVYIERDSEYYKWQKHTVTGTLCIFGLDTFAMVKVWDKLKCLGAKIK